MGAKRCFVGRRSGERALGFEVYFAAPQLSVPLARRTSRAPSPCTQSWRRRAPTRTTLLPIQGDLAQAKSSCARPRPMSRPPADRRRIKALVRSRLWRHRRKPQRTRAPPRLSPCARGAVSAERVRESRPSAVSNEATVGHVFVLEREAQRPRIPAPRALHAQAPARVLRTLSRCARRGATRKARA